MADIRDLQGKVKWWKDEIVVREREGERKVAEAKRTLAERERELEAAEREEAAAKAKQK